MQQGFSSLEKHHTQQYIDISTRDARSISLEFTTLHKSTKAALILNTGLPSHMQGILQQHEGYTQHHIKPMA